MYYRNDEQKKRKLDYHRYEQMTKKGYSIAEETSQSPLYVINDDPFGRTYYTKPLGEVAVRDPITGQQYTQEEWSIKEYIIDNKAQLINKISADLVIGKSIDIKFDDTISIAEEMNKWLKDLIKKSKLSTKLREAALQNSSLGDQFFETCLYENRIIFKKIEPAIIEIIEDDNGDVHCYEIAWEIECEEHKTESQLLGKSKKTKTVTYVQKKIHYKGKIIHKLYLMKVDELLPVPLTKIEENRVFVEKAISTKNKNIKALVSTSEDEDEDDEYKDAVTKDADSVYTIIEYTGINSNLITHWPNYIMFGIYGMSDNGMIENLQNALNNRETQLNDVLDKHADPPMYGPSDFLDANGNLTMSGGGGRYFPVNGESKPPGYMEWGGHLEDCQKEIFRLYKAILDNTETSQSLTGEDSGGISSGRALMYKLIRSLCMAARKREYADQAIIDLIDTAQKMKIVWIDGNGWDKAEQLTEEEGEKLDAMVIPIIIGYTSAIPVDDDALVRNVTTLVKDKVISKETGLDIISKLFDEVIKDEEMKRLGKEGDAEQAKAEAAKPEALIPDTDAIIKSQMMKGNSKTIGSDLIDDESDEE